MNGIMEVLLAYAERLARENLQRDPYYQKRQIEWDALITTFRSRHSRNQTLMDEVNNLQDAHGAVLFLESDFLFFLGLQMGLELGRIDLLRDTDGSVYPFVKGGWPSA